MQEIKDAVREFKQRNGNDVFTLKEMIMYVITRVDKMDKRLEVGAGSISENRTGILYLKRFMYVSLILIVGTLGWLIKIHVR